MHIPDQILHSRELLEAEPGVDWNEALRLNTLNACQAWLESKGDPNKELPNVISIIDAYRSGELTWEEGKVTYWRGGRNVGGPPDEFTWERFHELNGNNKGEGFWIEPVSSYIVPCLYIRILIISRDTRHKYVRRKGL